MLPGRDDAGPDENGHPIGIDRRVRWVGTTDDGSADWRPEHPDRLRYVGDAGRADGPNCRARGDGRRGRVLLFDGHIVPTGHTLPADGGRAAD
ncbi:hypothetical protein [Halalkalicoccus tibetensis]|uniref:Uncharacterized protein n=1 Tax=Halalkalicoccus tibetensis TaxID=175632 RepID=A0ABD5V5J3_9EURY